MVGYTRCNTEVGDYTDGGEGCFLPLTLWGMVGLVPSPEEEKVKFLYIFIHNFIMQQVIHRQAQHRLATNTKQ